MVIDNGKRGTNPEDPLSHLTREVDIEDKNITIFEITTNGGLVWFFGSSVKGKEEGEVSFGSSSNFLLVSKGTVVCSNKKKLILSFFSESHEEEEGRKDTILTFGVVDDSDGSFRFCYFFVGCVGPVEDSRRRGRRGGRRRGRGRGRSIRGRG